MFSDSRGKFILTVSVKPRNGNCFHGIIPERKGLNKGIWPLRASFAVSTDHESEIWNREYNTEKLQKTSHLSSHLILAQIEKNIILNQGCVPFCESKNGFLIRDLPDFAAERNVKSESGSVALVTFCKLMCSIWRPRKK